MDMNVRLICVGKIKEPYLRKGIEHYKNLLGKKANVELIEVEDEKTPDHAGKKEEDRIKKTEGSRILRHIPADSFVFALCIEGKQWTTASFRSQIQKIEQSGKRTITFIIGGSLGLSEEVIKKANIKISFSAMTFPHQMMRMILLEQLERVFLPL